MPRKMAREASPTPNPARSRVRTAAKSDVQDPAVSPAPDANAIAAAKTPVPTSKIDMVRNLLRRAEGATLAEMIEATGWQPHTMRAALTGLRKRGHTIEKSKRGETTCYRIVEAR